MATKRNPLHIQYTKLATQVRRESRELTNYNYTEPSTHIIIASKMQAIRDMILEMKKLLDAIGKEKLVISKMQLSASDHKYYNKAEKHERAYLPKRKTVRTYTKKKTLAAKDKPILNKTQMRRFLSWIRQGNATEIEPNVWLEQTTQGMQEFTYNELQKFFKKEYIN
jgi:hypothetical protein